MSPLASKAQKKYPTVFSQAREYSPRPSLESFSNLCYIFFSRNVIGKYYLGKYFLGLHLVRGPFTGLSGSPFSNNLQCLTEVVLFRVFDNCVFC